ncbi:hypothetical protein U27_00854 [Candidatus Vecturithrix granuli]|uniref:DUF2281 domain-containing protein n=1 Tax=Vecturithrix granuli TaxID=1499967 RepID=A0A081C8Q1_VECG1|nr:hypothetical protein U27_00854 [Candidatus Vecturithrix granuli]
MQHTQTLKFDIISALDSLPEESLQLLFDFVAFLQVRSKPATQQKPVIKLGGLWEGTATITDEDIAEARLEMWGNLGEREL